MAREIEGGLDEDTVEDTVLDVIVAKDPLLDDGSRPEVGC